MPGLGRRARELRAAYLRLAPSIIGAVAVVLGFALLVDAVLPHRLRTSAVMTALLPVPARATAEAVCVVGGALLLRVARGLRKRKRLEWRVAVLVSTAVLVADTVRGDRRLVEAVLTGLLLTILVLARSRYTAEDDPRSRWFAVRVGVQFVVGAVGYGMLLLYMPHHVPASVSAWARLREVVLSLAGFGGQVRIRGDHYADFVHATLLVCGLVTAVCVTTLALRPVEPIAGISGVDEQRLRQLLTAHGARDSLGYFALRRDKAVVWSASGKAAITYRVVCGVALASGDPLGDPEAWPGAISAYRAMVEQYGWTPAVMGCSELGAVVYQREYGLSAVALGDEAIVSTAEFTLEGRRMRPVRQPAMHAARAGYEVRVRRIADIAPDELADVALAAAAWRTDPVERGFSMALSRLGDPCDGDCVLVSAHLDGRLAGLLHFVPWGRDGLSLDLMRRDRDAHNGLNELMIVRLLQLAPTLGYARVSLNFAVFRDALERGERIGAGPVLRLWRRLLLVASRWWQIESLYRFNDKFGPVWQPRFFSYPRARDVPRIAWAALEAEAFVVRPKRINRLLRRAA